MVAAKMVFVGFFWRGLEGQSTIFFLGGGSCSLRSLLCLLFLWLVIVGCHWLLLHLQIPLTI